MDRRARIKDGAIIGCDMHVVKWRDDGEIFEAFPFTESKMRLIAPGYGGKPYGNGPLYVRTHDVVLSSEEGGRSGSR